MAGSQREQQGYEEHELSHRGHLSTLKHLCIAEEEQNASNPHCLRV